VPGAATIYNRGMSEERAKRIKLLLFDVDGVLTDGTIFLFPAPAGAEQVTQREAAQRADAGGYAIVSTNMIEAKGFHAHDGTAFSLARLGGLKTGFITKRISETVRLRARDLKVEICYQGQAEKIAAFREILAQTGLTAEEVGYVGDDVIDLPVMEKCGLAIAVANARSEVKRMAHYVTEHKGGEGAARDAIEYILQSQGKLQKAVADYLANRGGSTAGSDMGEGK
jgi:3-deoxy-D-manno-octulosonate 8-phosphate phosphatase (KDO 8-P phosphatase)